ncbi:MAG: hypothetical protein GY711_23815 [bacterium]|nr:hypothetical protein [bacterium]
MKSLPLYTVLFLSALILAWNLSFHDIDAGERRQRADAGGDMARGAVDELVSRMGPEEKRDPGIFDLVPTGSGPMGEGIAGTGRRDAASADPPSGPSLEGGNPLGEGANDDARARRLERYAGGARRAQGYERAGMRIGFWIEWWENGAVKSEGEYEEDEPSGDWVHRHRSGNVHLRGQYEEGARIGIWRGWHDTGDPKIEAIYDGGEPSGVWTLWYSNGQVMQTGRYVRGCREGAWEFFDFDGRVDLRTGTYESGARID